MPATNLNGALELFQWCVAQTLITTSEVHSFQTYENYMQEADYEHAVWLGHVQYSQMVFASDLPEWIHLKNFATILQSFADRNYLPSI